MPGGSAKNRTPQEHFEQKNLMIARSPLRSGSSPVTRVEVQVLSFALQNIRETLLSPGLLLEQILGGPQAGLHVLGRSAQVLVPRHVLDSGQVLGLLAPVREP